MDETAQRRFEDKPVEDRIFILRQSLEAIVRQSADPVFVGSIPAICQSPYFPIDDGTPLVRLEPASLVTFGDAEDTPQSAEIPSPINETPSPNSSISLPDPAWRSISDASGRRE